MHKKISIVLLVTILILLSGCSGNATRKSAGIDITGITSSIGAVGENTKDFETQSFKYTITLTNNDEEDITIISVRPVISEKLHERISSKDITLQVNRVIPKGGSLGVSGEIIFDAKGLTKEQTVSMEPFVKEVRIIEERIIDKTF